MRDSAPAQSRRGRRRSYLWSGATVCRELRDLGHPRSPCCFASLVRCRAKGVRHQVTYCRTCPRQSTTRSWRCGAAASEEIPCWALAERNTREFHTIAYALLGAGRRTWSLVPDLAHPHYRAHRAAGDEGHAYATRRRRLLRVTTTWTTVTLARQPSSAQLPSPLTEDMRGANPPGAPRETPAGLRLWKGAKARLAVLADPLWSRPSWWHIECSSMAAGYLGSTSTSTRRPGLNLLPAPLERARASNMAGDIARYWVHHGLFTIVGTKISKTLGTCLPSRTRCRGSAPQSCALTPTSASPPTHPLDIWLAQSRRSRTPLPPTTDRNASSPARSTHRLRPLPADGLCRSPSPPRRRRPQRSFRARRRAGHMWRDGNSPL